MELRALIVAIALPAAAALAGLWLIWRRPANPWPDPRPGVTSVLLGLLWVVALVGGFGLSAWPPVSGPDRLPYALLGLTLLGGAAGWMRRGGAWVGALACAGAFVFISWGLIARAWTWPVALLWVGVPWVLAAGATAGLRRAGRDRGAMVPVAFFGVAVCAAVTLVLTGHITTTLRVGAIAACVGPAMVVAAARRGLALGPVLGVLGACLLALVYFAIVLGETPWLCGVLIAGAVGAVGLVVPRGGDGPEQGALRAWRGRSTRRAAALVAVPGVLAAGAVVVALLNQPRAEEEAGVGTVERVAAAGR